VQGISIRVEFQVLNKFDSRFCLKVKEANNWRFLSSSVNG